MSAFIVEDNTINKVVTWLGHELRKSSDIRRVAEKFNVDVEGSGWEQRLAQGMYELNVKAVNQRYHEENTFDRFVYHPTLYGSSIAAYKSLQCWIYQCTEGTVPDTNLYKYFDELEKHVAISIVMDLPAYEKATWG